MELQSIKISVVTVTFNAESVIENTIESVLKQTYSNIEYILVDGCSSDNTLNIVKKYEKDISKIIVEKDRGIYDAMNKGLSMADGDYLIFMNAGDSFIMNFTIESIVKKMTKQNSIYYGDVLYTDRDSMQLHFYGGKFNKFRFCFQNICHQSIFYPKIVYKQLQYNLDYTIFADYDYNINLIANKFNFIYVNDLVSFYDANGLSTKGKDLFATKKLSIIYKKLGLMYYLYYVLKYNIRFRKYIRLLLVKFK